MKSVAVFCGSKNGASNVYIEGAKKFGEELAKKDIKLVYGGAGIGIMGAVANSVLQAGGKVIGVMPNFLDSKERSHPNLTELLIVDSMHERKAKMADLADGFIVLPGGPGTMEEFFEVFTWGQLGLHQKPIGVLNLNHYYDPLIALFNQMTDEHFMNEPFLSMVLFDEEPIGLLNQFAKFHPIDTKQYLTEDKT